MIRAAYFVFGAALAVAPLVYSAAAPGAPVVAMSAMHSESSLGGKPISLPRLIRLPDAKIMAKINAALAVQQKQDRQSAADCLTNVKDSGRKPSDGSYDVTVKITHLSAKYLSLTDTASYDCAGAHPDFTQTALTFDLTTGAAMDVMAAFKPGFVDRTFPKLYAARYRLPKQKDDDADCRGWANDATNLTELRPRLDATAGIVIGFEVAHVVAACADDLTLTLADLAANLKDGKLLADLKANVKPHK